MGEIDDWDSLGLGITSRQIRELPHLARLALAYRCSRRVRDPLLANWFDGETMWDHVGFVSTKFIPAVEGKLEGLPLDPKLAECVLELRAGLRAATDAVIRIRTPSVVFRCYGVLLATAYCALGQDTIIDALCGTVSMFELINPGSSLTKQAIVSDINFMVETVRQHGLQDASPPPKHSYADKLWPAGEPAYFNESLFQKTPSVALDVFKHALPAASKFLLQIFGRR